MIRFSSLLILFVSASVNALEWNESIVCLREAFATKVGCKGKEMSTYKAANYCHQLYKDENFEVSPFPMSCVAEDQREGLRALHELMFAEADFGAPLDKKTYYLKRLRKRKGQQEIFKIISKVGLSGSRQYTETLYSTFAFKDEPGISHESELGASCQKALGQFYRSGKRLLLKSIQEHKKPIREDPLFQNQLAPYNGYHYTDAIAVLNLLEDGGSVADYRAIMHYLKSRDGGYLDRVGAFYVASDPDSSRYIGNIQVKLTFDNSAMTFDQTVFNWSTAREEYIATYPQLADDCEISQLKLLIFEDNQVDLVQYYFAKGWYQMISFRAVQSAVAVRY